MIIYTRALPSRERVSCHVNKFPQLYPRSIPRVTHVNNHSTHVNLSISKSFLPIETHHNRCSKHSSVANAEPASTTDQPCRITSGEIINSRSRLTSKTRR